VRELLKMYLDEGVLFSTTRDWARLAKINSDTAKLQNELWAAVRPAATVRTTSIVVSLVISGMNDVLNSQGYTQAAWWNRIPIAAWALMPAIAIRCNMLIGYGARRRDWHVFLILPIAVSMPFFLISDIDSPRSGLIHVRPQNLESLAESFHSQ